MSKLQLIFVPLFLAISFSSFSQVGIGTDAPDASAALDITSTTSGLLIPRMTDQQRLDISEPVAGLMVYQTNQTAGFYYYNGNSWSEVGDNDKTYSVNTFYAELGGYVIEVNTDGTHGLVVAMQDQGVVIWFEANNLFSNASNYDIDGAKFKDWRMPTKRELNLMYGVYNGGNGANLSANHYWSSSGNNYTYAWTQNFAYLGEQNQSIFRKNGTNYAYYVRAVRAF